MVLPGHSEITMTTTSATTKGFRGGRPKLESQDRRKPYGVRLSERELHQVRERAKSEGMDVSTYCRQAILNSRPRSVVPAINRRAWFELSALSDAVVRLARQPERGHSPQDAELLEELCRLLKATRLELMGVPQFQDDSDDR